MLLLLTEATIEEKMNLSQMPSHIPVKTTHYLRKSEHAHSDNIISTGDEEETGKSRMGMVHWATDISYT